MMIDGTTEKPPPIKKKKDGIEIKGKRLVLSDSTTGASGLIGTVVLMTEWESSGDCF